ncbi:STAS domain-containing protein [Streptomyces sp. NPDC057382]|uniref:STAS domain-containing protein n=1 Tax=unclassified Streptomyces TaxID=2593676 RepID=UPI00362829C4
MPEPANAAGSRTRPAAVEAAGAGARVALPACLAELDVSADGDRTTVTLRGELDLGAHRLLPDLHAALALSGSGIDLRLDGVAFIDCAGLYVLRDLRERAREQGRTVTVRAGSPAVERLLALTGTRALFTGPQQGPDRAAPRPRIVRPAEGPAADRGPGTARRRPDRGTVAAFAPAS